MDKSLKLKFSTREQRFIGGSSGCLIELVEELMVVSSMTKHLGQSVIQVPILTVTLLSLSVRNRFFLFCSWGLVKFTFSTVECRVTWRMFHGNLGSCISLRIWTLQCSSWLCRVLCFSFGTSGDRWWYWGWVCFCVFLAEADLLKKEIYIIEPPFIVFTRWRHPSLFVVSISINSSC